MANVSVKQAPIGAELPTAAINRPHSRLLEYFVGEFILRTALPLAETFDNDYELLLIFLTIITQNSQNLMLNQGARKRYASLAATVPEPLVRPISRVALARSTNLPRETVRRKVLKLIERGYVEETPRGLIVPARLRERPLYGEAIAAQEANLRRLFSMVGEAITADTAAAAPEAFNDPS